MVVFSYIPFWVEGVGVMFEGASCLGTRGGITRLPKQGNGSKWKLEEEKSLTFKVYGKRCSKRSYLVYVVE